MQYGLSTHCIRPVDNALVANAIPTMTALTAMSTSDSMMKKTGDISVDTASEESEKNFIFRTVFFNGAVYVSEETGVISVSLEAVIYRAILRDPPCLNILKASMFVVI